MNAYQDKNENDNVGKEEEDAQLLLRPPKEERFDKDIVRENIANTLNEELSGRVYDKDEADKLCKQISSKIKAKMRATIHSNYKLVCHIRLGEQRGAGIRVVARCLWDSENDGVVTMAYENDSIFCVASVFAVYFY